MVLIYPSLDSLEAVEGTCDQRRPSSACAHAQADLGLRWSQSLIIRIVMRWLTEYDQTWYHSLMILLLLPRRYAREIRGMPLRMVIGSQQGPTEELFIRLLLCPSSCDFTYGTDRYVNTKFPYWTSIYSLLIVN